jgi:glycosyltransferase involved in cell wall biosynthesis
MHNLGRYSSDATGSSIPGEPLPYVVQHLRKYFSLTWSDSQLNGLWRTRPSRNVGRAVRLLAPGLQGSLGACYAMPQLHTADVALSIFENEGLGFARLQKLPQFRRSAIPHVMLACWLAEACQHMSPSRLRSIRRSIESVSLVGVFSANQVAILSEYLGLAPERIRVISYGIDSEYFRHSATSGPASGGGLVAVGGDSRRDYATLLEAVRISGVHLTLACYPRNIAGLKLPPNVTLRLGVPRAEYRRLLHSADLVVTPTMAPAYPCGQSVMLEAMSMGKATLTTDSPAIRDYLTDGVDGVLTPSHDPLQMAKTIGILLSDGQYRQALGNAAAKTVRGRFSVEHFWHAVTELLIESCRVGRSLGESHP